MLGCVVAGSLPLSITKSLVIAAPGCVATLRQFISSGREPLLPVTAESPTDAKGSAELRATQTSQTYQ
jgi:hypothetical protein